ncbi:MAG: hypothetical protein DBY25_04540 [Clostridiales bacterium]|nr:MAG: hypothetical protein DBY25_04540 [Clostridiales bacterium]
MDNETKEMFHLLLEKINSIDERTKKTDLRLENEIVPNLQLVLENQSSVIATKKQVTELAEKLDDVASDVDVIKEVVTQHSGEIDRLKKHA